MNRFILHMVSAFLLLIGAGNAYAQDKALINRLYDKFSASCVGIEYGYVSRVSGVNIKGSGSLVLQGDMWHNEGNGIEMWCDGKTVWTVDHDAMEVVIDSVSGNGEEADITNPALMFMKMQDLFNVKQVLGSSDGKAEIYVLEPKGDIGIDFFDVEILKSDASIRSGSFALEDGNKFDITVNSMTINEKKSATSFRPSQTFDYNWIVTDLR